jgi:maltose-binding protein MalE
LAFAGTSAASLTVAQKATIAQTLFTTDLASVVFTQTTGAGTNSYVFNNNTLGDSLVELVGVTATSLTATAATAGAGVVVIG